MLCRSLRASQSLICIAPPAASLALTLNTHRMASSWGFATSVIHKGQAPDPTTGAIAIPISLSTTFAQATPGAPPGKSSDLSYGKGFEYSRTNNPTRAAFETAFAASESAKHGLAFASGMAATATVLHLLEAGNHILCIDDVYGGTQRYFRLVRAAQEGAGRCRAVRPLHAALLPRRSPSPRTAWT